jgi:hypothetical protein
MIPLLLLVLTQTPVNVTNTKANATAIAARCVNAAGTAFEACGGAGGSSWFPDGGTIGIVNQGTPASTANRWPMQITDGTDLAGVTAAGALQVDGSATTQPVSGTVAVSNAFFLDATFTARFMAGAAMTDNFANPTTTGVQSFGLLWDGSGWDRAPGTSADGALVNLGANNDVTITSGTVTASNAFLLDATFTGRFAAGAVAADNFANPTTTGTLAFGMLWDGATWDRFAGNAADGALVNLGANNDVTVTSGAITASQATASSLNAEVQGDAAHAAAVSGNPVQEGAYAEADAAALDSTGVVEGEMTRLKATIEGQLLTRIDHPNRWHCVVDAATADTQCQATGAQLYLTDVWITNGPTASTLAVTIGTGAACATGRTVIIPSTYLGVNGGAATNLITPIKVTASQNVCCDTAGSTSFSCRLGGFTAP